MRTSSGHLLPAEKPPFEGLQQLAACERLQVLGVPIALRDAEIVLERLVRGLECVVELKTLEEIVVSPRLVTRAVLRIDRATNRPERALLALDPDHDGLFHAGVVDTVDGALGEAALR